MKNSFIKSRSLFSRDPSSLSDTELISICLYKGIKGKSAIELSRELLLQFGSLRNLFCASYQDFQHIKGFTFAKYNQLHAAFEITQRYLHETIQRENIFTNTLHAKNFLRIRMRDLAYEVFAVLFLDNKNRLIYFEELFRGSVSNVQIHPRVIVKHALKYNASALILAHNHPSGIAEPSLEDKTITKKLVRALDLIDVKILDHFIIGDNEVSSFVELGLL